MAIINNAHAGSDVSLLCLIYRVIARNNGRLTVDDITALCRPATLPDSANAEKKFGENLRFWLDEDHQLWSRDDEGKLGIKVTEDWKNPSAIAVAANKALFATPIHNITESDQKATEGLFRALAGLLASDYFSFSTGRRMGNRELDNFFAYNLAKFAPNNNEKPVIRDYGLFLGFFERDGSGIYVDPTRAIHGAVREVFEDDDELHISEFLRRLANVLPVLDGGAYRQEIEAQMTGPLSSDSDKRQISVALSLALERLSYKHVLRYEARSDDPESWTLQLPGKSAIASVVQRGQMEA